MILEKDLNYKSSRLSYRHLTQSDATDEYASWFNDKNVKKFIHSANNFIQKENLITYINMHNAKSDSILLGVFKNNTHIGNIKYEPIDFNKKLAWLGILIGNKSNRSKGYGGEIIKSTSLLLQNKLDIKTLKLGVNINNIAALKSYEKLGFTVVKKKVESNILELDLDSN